jgi:hypothetical protein
MDEAPGARSVEPIKGSPSYVVLGGGWVVRIWTVRIVPGLTTHLTCNACGCTLGKIEQGTSNLRLIGQVTADLAVELWPGDGAHICLVSSSYPVKVAVVD